MNDTMTTRQAEISVLEHQIESLLTAHQKTTHENKSLRLQLARITQKHAQLSEQKNKVVSQIKRIISKLKEEIQ